MLPKTLTERAGQTGKPGWQKFWIAGTLVLLVLIAFEPVRHNSFVEFDDNQYLLENTHIQGGFTPAAVGWAFSSGYAANWHPLTWLSHTLDVQLFGLNPVAHHLHNVLLHALTTILLFWILTSMTGAMWRSAAVAALFGIHPLHVESVAWAAERKDVLCAFFWVLTIVAYAAFVRRGGGIRYVLVLLSFTLGLLAKPMIVTLPLVLLALDYWPLNRFRTSAHLARPDQRRLIFRLLIEKIPLLILAAASCVITYLVQEHGKSMTPDLPIALRLANALTSYTAYLGKLFWPSNLAVLYPYPTEWPYWKPIAAAALLSIISVFVCFRSATRPWLAAGWFWFLIALGPVIGIVQVGAQSMADRYAYLPSIGLSMALVWGVVDISSRWRHQKLMFAIGGAVIGIASICATRTQVTYWKDSVSLFQRAVSVTENNHVMHHSLGWALAREGRLNEASVHFQESLKIRPDIDTTLDMADVLIKQNDFLLAANYLNRILKAQPTNAVAYYNLGIMYQTQENLEAAANAYEQAIRFNPLHADALNNLGILRCQQDRWTEAVECFRKSLMIVPEKSSTLRNLATALQLDGKPGEAVTYYRRALNLDPNDGDASGGLACALYEMQQLSEAAEYNRYTLRLRPDDIRALNDLALILLQITNKAPRQTEEALALAYKACELTSFSDSEVLATLAKAQASANVLSEPKVSGERESKRPPQVKM